MNLPAVKTMGLISPLNQLATPVEVRQVGSELVESSPVQLAILNKMAQLIENLKSENNELKNQLKIASKKVQTISADLAAMQQQSRVFVD
jgi:cell shape-determining protein MreC